MFILSKNGIGLELIQAFSCLLNNAAIYTIQFRSLEYISSAHRPIHCQIASNFRGSHTPLLIDWKFETEGNSGIIYHCSEEGGQPYEIGPEMQVMIHPADKVPGKNDGGSYYDVVAPTKIATKGKGEWNTYKVVCNGTKVEHWVNGEKVVDVDTGTEEFKAKIAASKWGKVKLFNTVKNGYIDLQDHGSKIAFKNIKIKVLLETK